MIDTHAVGLAVLTASVTLQVLATVAAIRLVPLTSHRLPWTLMASALAIMAIRRAIPLWHLLAAGSHGQPVDVAAESFALAASGLVFAGVTAIRPMFEAMQRADASLRASERRYRRLFEAHRGVSLLDRRGDGPGGRSRPGRS